MRRLSTGRSVVETNPHWGEASRGGQLLDQRRRMRLKVSLNFESGSERSGKVG